MYDSKSEKPNTSAISAADEILKSNRSCPLGQADSLLSDQTHMNDKLHGPLSGSDTEVTAKQDLQQRNHWHGKFHKSSWIGFDGKTIAAEAEPHFDYSRRGSLSTSWTRHFPSVPFSQTPFRYGPVIPTAGQQMKRPLSSCFRDRENIGAYHRNEEAAEREDTPHLI